MGILDKLFSRKKKHIQEVQQVDNITQPVVGIQDEKPSYLLSIEELSIKAIKLIENGMDCTRSNLQLNLEIGYHQAGLLKEYLDNKKKEKTIINNNACYEEYNGEDKVKVKLDEISNNSAADPILRIRCYKLSNQGYSHIYIKEDAYNEVLEKKKQREYTQYIIQKTADLNNEGIRLEKSGSIDEAILIYEEAVKLEVVATHSYDRLMLLYRQKKDYENEIRVAKIAIGVFGKENEKRMGNGYDINRYINCIEKASRAITGEKATFIYPKEPISIPVPKSGSLGAEFEYLLTKIPEFDFYKDKPDDISTLEYQMPHIQITGKETDRGLEINRIFLSMIQEAGNYEQRYDLEKAADLYEHIINEKCLKTAPYDRLIKIYSKAGLPNQEKRVLQLAISFFSELRLKQEEYVKQLAEKAGKLDFCLNRIDRKEKIFYYSGIFELYNPFPIVEKWKDRLNKLTEKSERKPFPK